MQSVKQDGKFKVTIETGGVFSFQIESNSLMNQIKEVLLEDLENNLFGDVAKREKTYDIIKDVVSKKIENTVDFEKVVKDAIYSILLKYVKTAADKNDHVRKKKNEMIKDKKWVVMTADDKVSFYIEALALSELKNHVIDFVKKMKITTG
jgi:hypothetical protein